MENLTFDEVLTLRELLNDFLLQSKIREDSTEFITSETQIRISEMPNVRSILQKIETRINTPSMAL